MKIVVNGTTVEVPDGSNVSVVGDQVLVNGKSTDGGGVSSENQMIFWKKCKVMYRLWKSGYSPSRARQVISYLDKIIR